MGGMSSLQVYNAEQWHRNRLRRANSRSRSYPKRNRPNNLSNLVVDHNALNQMPPNAHPSSTHEVLRGQELLRKLISPMSVNTQGSLASTTVVADSFIKENNQRRLIRGSGATDNDVRIRSISKEKAATPVECEVDLSLLKKGSGLNKLSRFPRKRKMPPENRERQAEVLL